MFYKYFKDLKLSALGMGCMRLPVDENNTIIEDEVCKMVDYAFENGVNYFDTAWGYHLEQSEIVMGKVLKRLPRDKFYLATKFPGYDLANMGKVEEIFEKQLSKCQVEYFDFYLVHNVCEMNIEEYLDPKYGTIPYLVKQLENGRIKHLGFSSHANIDNLKRFLDAYGDVMEFCQLQVNWIDWKFQGAKEKVEEVTKRGIPVWVMEPLRGGKLVSLVGAETSFRFIESLDNIGVTLSGMSNLEQVKENIEIFKEENPLSVSERLDLEHKADKFLEKTTVPCTACRYCVEYCPQNLDIPTLLRLYNEHSFTDGGFIAPMTLSKYSEDEKPSACLGCRSCEAVCPQNIKISEVMSDFVERLG